MLLVSRPFLWHRSRLPLERWNTHSLATLARFTLSLLTAIGGLVRLWGLGGRWFSPHINICRAPWERGGFPFATLRTRGGPPPPVFTKTNKHAGENERVCKIACKNLIAKNLQIKILITKDLGRPDSNWPRCVGLDHHRAIGIVGARLDVTECCGKGCSSPSVALKVKDSARRKQEGGGIGPRSAEEVEVRGAHLSQNRRKVGHPHSWYGRIWASPPW
jgi:hypothetical protein